MAQEYFSPEYNASVQHPGQAGYSYQQQAGYGGYNAYYQQHQGYEQQAYQQQAYYPQQQHAYGQQQQQQLAYGQQHAGYADAGYGGTHGQYAGGWQPQEAVDHGALPLQPAEPQPPLPDGPPPLPPAEPQHPFPQQPPLPPESPGGPPLPPSSQSQPQPPGMAPGHAPQQPSAHVPGLQHAAQLHYTQQQQQQQGPAAQHYPQYQQPYQQQQGYQEQQAYQPQQHLQQQQQQLPQQQLATQQYQQQQYHAQQGYYANGWATASQAPYVPHAAAPYAAGPKAPTLQQTTAAASPGGISLQPPLLPTQALAQAQMQQQQQQQPAPTPAQPPQPPRRDILQLLLPPGRASRPKRIVMLLRGLPGSGKSHVARLIRDKEVEQGGEPPRILSLDDYFVTEVEREVEDEEGAGAKKGKKRKVQSMEYRYEPEMEGVYVRSLLKAYQRTLEEGRFKFVVLDAPNVGVADFKPFWLAGQAAGYEVFVMEAAEGDPQVCQQRNQHGRQLEDIRRLAAAYEPTPAVYTCLDVGGLLVKRLPGGKASISDVEMGEDVEDEGGSDAEQDAPAAVPASSRWASLEDDSSTAAQRAKRARLAPGSAGGGASSGSVGSAGSASMQDASSSYDGLADGIDELLHSGAAAGRVRAAGAGSGGRGSSASGRARGILVSGGNGSGGGKRVRWPDQMEEDGESDAGFRIAAQPRQLETVYLVPGLGPPSESAGPPHSTNFAAAVRAEHQVEANAFRSILLGGAQKHPHPHPPGWSGRP